MTQDIPTRLRSDEKVRAEFDMLADEYHEQHKANITITGEGPEYFAEYKIADLARLTARDAVRTDSILDFGSGIGNSLPYLRKYFANSRLSCGDVSARSIEIAKTRFPGPEDYALIEGTIPLPDHSQDIVFSACVFHHIPHAEHLHWLAELRRVTRPGGLLAIYEHNPMNPLTVRAVNTCPLDVNARLIRSGTMRQRALQSGWTRAEVQYKLFFPSVIKGLRPLEKHLEWCGLGAQYLMAARAPR
jgi:SAM-dependent methyltransferase